MVRIYPQLSQAISSNNSLVRKASPYHPVGLNIRRRIKLSIEFMHRSHRIRTAFESGTPEANVLVDDGIEETAAGEALNEVFANDKPANLFAIKSFPLDAELNFAPPPGHRDDVSNHEPIQWRRAKNIWMSYHEVPDLYLYLSICYANSLLALLTSLFRKAWLEGEGVGGIGTVLR